MKATLCRRDGDGDGDGGGLSLPEDIVIDVLARLPAKDLCRFRCVSKGWRALVSDPALVAAQRSRTGPVIVAMFGSEPEHQLRLLDMEGNVLRVFDLRGRATLALTRLDLILVNRAHPWAVIIDPASGRDFSIIGTKDGQWSLIGHDYSFGRAEQSGDYKVLCLHDSSWDGHGNRWCEVATIMNDGGAKTSWRRRPWGPLNQTGFFCEYKATASGVLYFMLDVDFAYPDRISIAAFDLENEEWKPEPIKAPLLGLKKEGDSWFFRLTELKGALCFVHINLQNSGGNYSNIWLLMDPNMSIWVKEYTIQMPERMLSTKPLDALGDGTVLLVLSKLVRARESDTYYRYILQLYDSSTKVFTQLTEMAEGFSGRTAIYTGSLLS